VQFGMAMHIRPPNMNINQNVKISKSKMADDGHLENQKLRYLQNLLADFAEFCTITHISLQSLPAVKNKIL